MTLVKVDLEKIVRLAQELEYVCAQVAQQYVVKAIEFTRSKGDVKQADFMLEMAVPFIKASSIAETVTELVLRREHVDQETEDDVKKHLAEVIAVYVQAQKDAK